MDMSYHINKFGAIETGDSDKDLAISAANSVAYKGEMITPPSGVSFPRWNAMITFILKNGDKCLRRENQVVK